MKLCFYHQPFDVDVSSGTVHARHQWHELAHAFGVTEMAVVNQTTDRFSSVNESIKISEYNSLTDFIQSKKHLHANCVFVEQGPYPDHRTRVIDPDTWIVFGGTQGLPPNPLGDTITIKTKAALYPRQAAAIILENQWAQSHS
jgi:tRNA(Leu) C34 or U34 (ribose-2'-O)-methylase TrmL